MTGTTFTRVWRQEVIKTQVTRQGVNAVVYDRESGDEIENEMFPDAEAAIEWIKYLLPYDNYEIKQFTNPSTQREAIDVVPSEGDYMGTVWL